MRGERTTQLLLACTLSIVAAVVVTIYALLTRDVGTLSGAVTGGVLAYLVRYHYSTTQQETT